MDLFNSKTVQALAGEINELRSQNTSLIARIKLIEEVQNNLANDFLVVLKKLNEIEEKNKPKYFG